MGRALADRKNPRVGMVLLFRKTQGILFLFLRAGAERYLVIMMYGRYIDYKLVKGTQRLIIMVYICKSSGFGPVACLGLVDHPSHGENPRKELVVLTRNMHTDNRHNHAYMNT